MKKIRLKDQTEFEVYYITNTNTLSIDILNADTTAMETVFLKKENLDIIQYYVGTELMKAYAGYTQITGST